jgi:phosphopantothenoylcysteine decarboxylase/phosphopantothenate--cysteine ligase
VSAEDMYNEVYKYYETSNITICSAAVADYKPSVVAENKIKKSTDTISIELVKTHDILSSLGKNKEQQILVGFALETENEIENAKIKLTKKNLDLIVLNSLNDKGAGFQKETNKVTIIDKFENISEFSLKSKAEVAKDIFNEILKNKYV